MEKFLKLLLNMPLFSGILPEQMDSMLGCLGASYKTIQRDSFVWIAGDDITSIGAVLDGEVNIIKEDFSGTRSILAKIGPGEVFGETFVCAGIGQSPVSVQAATDCRVMLLDFYRIISVCRNACPHHTQLIRNMLTIMAKKNLQLTEKINYMNKKTTREKVLSYLASQMDRHRSADIAIPYNRSELADFLGVNRSALSRELSRLRDDGVIEFERNVFHIKDIEAIAEALH